MPLPISAASYQPNPLIEVQATQMGKETGSKFSNIVDGLFEGAQKSINIQKGMQEIQMAPLEQERKNQASIRDAQKLELEKKKEDRLAQGQEFEQDYKNRELDIKKDEYQVKRDKADSTIRNTGYRAAVAAQDQARENITQGVVDQNLTYGNSDPLISILKDNTPEGRRQRQAIRGWAIKDAAGQRLVDNLQDGMENGTIRAEDIPAIQSFLATIDPHKNITTAQELAKKAPGIYYGTLGAVPEKDAEVTMIHDKVNGQFKFIQKRADGTSDPFAVAPDTMDPDKLYAIYQANNAVGQVARQRKRLSDSIAKVAELKAAQQGLPDQQEAPAQRTKTDIPLGLFAGTATPLTPAARTGLNNVVNKKSDEEIVAEQEAETKRLRQERARARAQTQFRR